MPRRLREHDVRPVTDLRGPWDFAFLGEVEPDDVDTASIAFGDVMAVPGCFDATPSYAGKRGLVAYRTRALALEAGHYRLAFDGVHHWCRVFADGRRLRDHAGGFTRFAADFDADAAGEVEVVVLVDNRFNYRRCPLHLDYMDWYHYGGIARGAELHCIGDVSIEGLRFETLDFSARKLSVAVRARSVAPSRTIPFVVAFDGETVIEEEVEVGGGEAELVREFSAPGAALWSPEEPALHEIHVWLDEDDMRERVGIRQVWAEGQKIVLNGKPVKLLGVNRHESHPQFGHGLPDALLVWDAQVMREMGCNFVRGSHYPQDVRWLDLCDELGIMVWCESTGWQHTAEHLTDPDFMGAQLTNIEEMVAVAQTHPSVIMYGILNESRSDDPACRPGYASLLGRLRELDPSRLLTYATCRLKGDVCLDLVDVVSVNDYPAWYHGDLADVPTVLDENARLVDEKGFADRPLILSEIGAEGLWGWRDWNARHWSEDYQAKLLDIVCKHVLSDRDRWSGIAIWQFCDVKSSEQTGRVLGRARGFNNKGVVDEYRRPKLAYDVVRRHFRAARGLEP
ncbi:MAG: glycoside hydrolase family 2 protein [Armatimonadota bacterium]